MAPEAPAEFNGETAVRDVGDELDETNDLAGVPAKEPPVTPTKFVPVIVTVVPPAAGPPVGLMPVTVGAATAAA